MSSVQSELLAKLNLGSFINGKWLTSGNGIDVINPATNEHITKVLGCSKTEVEDAINSAHSSQQQWALLPAQQRCDYLHKWHDQIMRLQDDLAALLTLEQGKPFAEAKGEIAYGAAYIKWFAEQGTQINGDTFAGNNQQQLNLIIKQGIGVATAITPWNFPSAMIARKAAAALAAGCTFIAKPAMETPLSALALAYTAELAQIPAGVFNIVLSDNAQQAGELLTQHPKVAKFSFTGSTAVGKKLMAQAAHGVKRVSMELGGNAPFIVFADADINKAIDGLMQAKFRNAGQTCVSANRVFVHQDIKEQFTELLLKRVKQLVMGNGLTDGIAIGPLIHQQAVSRISSWVEQAEKDGATIIYQADKGELNDNYFTPTILDNVTNDMAIAQQELFAPVINLIEFKNDDEVINQANNTDYGLASYFFTQNLTRTLTVSQQLQFGMVACNSGVVSNPSAPFGGVKQSGFGKEGSKYGLDDYLVTKYINLQG